MGFANGRVTFVRYRVNGQAPAPFSSETIELLEQHAIGRRPAEAADGVSYGWSAGDHVLDASFSLEKNVLEDALLFAIRIDTDKIPSQLLQAYTRIELDARAALNPSGRPTKAQREEAKEAARVRAEAESADGRFRRRRHDPVLWDSRSNTLFAGTTSSSVNDRLVALFQETFGLSIEPISAGVLAQDAASNLSIVSEAVPTSFVTNEEGLAALAWSPDPARPDYLGNEFLVWLWHTLKSDGGVITLADGSELSAMLTKTLTLDCPRGETGRDSLVDTGPTRLPEAFKALQHGKLPRKAGLLLDRQGQTYEFTLQAETLSISGLSLPKPEGVQGRDLTLARLESIRHFVDSFDMLFHAFLDRRLTDAWHGDLGRIRAWLTAA
jgi:hypothetical protein